MADLKGGSTVGESTILTYNTHNKVSPVVISGQIGSHVQPGIGLVPFNNLWVNTGGISYSTTTNRFTVPEDGIYKITFSFLFIIGSTNRLLVGINTDTPTTSTHKGHVYGSNGAAPEAANINSIVELNAGDYITFYVSSGAIYNQDDDRYGQFTIQKL